MASPNFPTSSTMANPRFQLLSPDEKAKDVVNRFTQNVEPVFESIQMKLGAHWTEYKYCYSKIFERKKRSEDFSAWSERQQLLVDKHPEILADHLGVIFLFKDIGIDFAPHLKRQDYEDKFGRVRLPAQKETYEDALHRVHGQEAALQGANANKYATPDPDTMQTLEDGTGGE